MNVLKHDQNTGSATAVVKIHYFFAASAIKAVWTKTCWFWMIVTNDSYSYY